MQTANDYLILAAVDFFDRRRFDRESLGTPFVYGSEVCRADHFLRPNFSWWSERLREPARFHRKHWEWVFISAALFERGKLQPGNRGLGFGVGSEPLPDAFASFGVEIVGTDQAIENATIQGWDKSAEHAQTKQQMYGRRISSDGDFDRLVSFETVDMNRIPDHMRGFDFCWSSCCLEHLGSLQHGIDFIHSSLNTLRPGGVAVHTTEFNLTSDDDTFEADVLSIYRRKDIVRVAEELRAASYQVAPLNFYAGAHAFEKYVDLPPFNLDAHIRTLCGAHVITSIALIVTKPCDFDPEIKKTQINF